MQNNELVKNAKEIVVSFIESLNKGDLKSARSYVSDNYSVTVPGASFDGAEAYFKGAEKAQQTYGSGRYDIKKVFTDGNDVCVLNDVIWGNATFLACGWYHLENQKIRSLTLIYDSGQANAARQGYVKDK
ncbi:MAG TPA: nuclear transport factor 2 family protein [Nitrososphaerales archaeon]|nr:nuclear transport factor 2 family protein [Nitrososphaerales archaeon]